MLLLYSVIDLELYLFIDDLYLRHFVTNLRTIEVKVKDSKLELFRAV